MFEDNERFLLSVGPEGDVLFQYSPPSPDTRTASLAQPDVVQHIPATLPEPIPEVRQGGGARQPPCRSPAPEAKEKAKSEKYVGRLGTVERHKTRQGKLVGEVYLTVDDPDKPGTSQLVKFAAFGDNAQALKDNYRPGQVVTAVGIPHEIQRRNREGKAWTERQLYFVNLPKPR